MKVLLSWGSRSEAALAAQLPVPIDICPMRRARRMRLRFDEAKGRLKLTCPVRTSRRKALAWALEQGDWIDRQISRAGPAVPFAHGVSIPVEGVDRRIDWDPSRPRQVNLEADRLICGGPESGLARRIELFLKAHALETMSQEVAEFASIAGVSARSVRVGDASSRWGSCSADGTIRLSWRLILAPPSLRRFVVAHEVAHLRHLDHGAEFKRLEAKLIGPGLARARAELRSLGPGLRRIGRGGR
jgi:predicted metal-dependent hydrolase